MAFEKWIKENPVKWDKSNYDSLDVQDFMEISFTIENSNEEMC